MVEIKVGRPTPQQLIIFDFDIELMQMGVKTQNEHVKKWLNPQDLLRQRLLRHYVDKLKFNEEETLLTIGDVESYYQDLRLDDLVTLDLNDTQLEGYVDLYNKELISDPHLQKLVRDTIREGISGYSHGGSILRKTDLK